MSSRLKKVGAKLCGNCNPHIASREVYKNIIQELEGVEGIEVVPKETPGLDILIVISGCPVDCAERPGGGYEEIVVAGESVDRVSCPSGEITEKVLGRLKQEQSKNNGENFNE